MPIETLQDGKPIPLFALNNFKKESKKKTPACYSAYDSKSLICAYCSRRLNHCKQVTEAAGAHAYNVESVRARIELTQKLEATPMPTQT
jgi:hypothetical protein